MSVRVLRDTDRAWLHDLIIREWGLPVVSISGSYDPSTLPGFVVDGEDGPLGALTYRLSEDSCEVVTLNTLRKRQGIGSALLAAAKAVAGREHLRLWLITTDGNLNAIRFHQGQGMEMAALHRDFVETVRRYKPDLDRDEHDIAFQHAIEFSY